MAISPSLAEAETWWRRAAEAGDSDAMCSTANATKPTG
jgi:TPR repeat protein